MEEKAQKTKKKRAKRGSAALKRQFPRKRAGVIVITCIKNKKAYVARSKDVEWLAWYIKKKLRYGCWHNEAMQEDYNLYGPQFFRFGLLGSWEYIGDELNEVWHDVELCWDAAQMEMRPAYNNQNRVVERMFLLRKSLDLLGKKYGYGQHMTPLRSWNPKGIYVLTCKKNQRRFVGMTTSFHYTIKELMQSLRRGTRSNPALVEDFRQYGEKGFLIEFCELPEATDEDLRRHRKEIAERLEAYYNEVGEKERCKNFHLNFKGAVARRSAPSKERTA